MSRMALVTIGVVLLAGASGCSHERTVTYMKMTDHGLTPISRQTAQLKQWQPSVESPFNPTNATTPDRANPLIGELPKPFEDVDTDKTIKYESAYKDPYAPDADRPRINPFRPDNWYWVRGNIRGGRIAISIDGIEIGRYSIKVDHEITDDMHKGTNVISFKPLPDLDGEPVHAHLDVVYSQQSPGAPPVISYDTDQLMELQRIRRLGRGEGDPSRNGLALTKEDTDPAAITQTLTIIAR